MSEREEKILIMSFINGLLSVISQQFVEDTNRVIDTYVVYTDPIKFRSSENDPDTEQYFSICVRSNRTVRFQTPQIIVDSTYEAVKQRIDNTYRNYRNVKAIMATNGHTISSNRVVSALSRYYSSLLGRSNTYDTENVSIMDDIGRILGRSIGVVFDYIVDCIEANDPTLVTTGSVVTNDFIQERTHFAINNGLIVKIRKFIPETGEVVYDFLLGEELLRAAKNDALGYTKR